MAEEPEHPIQVKARGKKLVTNSKRILDNIPGGCSDREAAGPD